MCLFRRVCQIFLQCGHRRQIPDEAILCDSARCKFSPNHPPNCQPPVCSRTCIQYHQYPEQFSLHINAKCHPACNGSA